MSEINYEEVERQTLVARNAVESVLDELVELQASIVLLSAAGGHGGDLVELMGSRAGARAKFYSAVTGVAWAGAEAVAGNDQGAGR